MSWIEVRGQSDIDNLLKKFGYFHDSCLKELHMWTGTYVDEDLSMTVPGELDTNIRVLFQRQCENPSAIELLFKSVTNFHIIPSPEDYYSIIYDAIIQKCDNQFYWANDINWRPANELSSRTSWIAARVLSWRDVSEWMGPKKRYDVQE